MVPVWRPFSNKNQKNGIQKGIQKSMPKKYGKLWKKHPKWCQNRCRNHLFFMFFRKRWKIGNHAPAAARAWFSRFWVPKISWKVDRRTSQNQCQKKACKRYEQINQNGSEMGAEIDAKSGKRRKKGHAKNDVEIWCSKGVAVPKTCLPYWNLVFWPGWGCRGGKCQHITNRLFHSSTRSLPQRGAAEKFRHRYRYRYS